MLFPSEVFATPVRAHEAEDGPFSSPPWPAPPVLEDALLGLLQAVVIVVEDLLGLVDVELVLRYSYRAARMIQSM